MLRALGVLALASLAACAGTAPDLSKTGAVKGSSGQLGAMLFLTDDLEEVKARWARPESPKVVPVGSVAPGRPVSAVIMFSGCARDETDHCRLVADYVLTDPSGNTHPSEVRPVCVHQRPPDEGRIGITEESPDFTVRSGPSGLYLIRARLRDEVAGEVLELETGFVLR
jgi:hypothetical protein